MNRFVRLLRLLPPERATCLEELFDHGEEGLCIEMLIENLFDFQVALTAEERDELTNVAIRYSVPVRYRNLINQIGDVALLAKPGDAVEAAPPERPGWQAR